MFALINTIFAQESAEAAHQQWRVVTDQLREKFPRLAAMMDAAEHEVLAFMDFPKEHRVKIHSTNVLERLNGEIKRRADVVGIFPNDRAIRRLVGALLLEQNDEYAIQKRYMGVESMAQLDLSGILCARHTMRDQGHGYAEKEADRRLSGSGPRGAA